MHKLSIPTPPAVAHNWDSFIQDAGKVCYIWVFKSRALARIETQYGSALAIAAITGVSRATAYRIISKHPKAYWVIDCTTEGMQRSWCVLPMEEIKKIEPRRVGNPNFANGLYQHAIAKNRARRARH